MCAEITPGRAYSRCPLTRHDTVTEPNVSRRYATSAITRTSTRPRSRSDRPPASIAIRVVQDPRGQRLLRRLEAVHERPEADRPVVMGERDGLVGERRRAVERERGAPLVLRR